MNQSSLLSLSGIPQNADQLNSWAQRIRTRICAISRGMVKLESERQQLLGMLWDAGLHEYEVDDAPSEPSSPLPYMCTPNAANPDGPGLREKRSSILSSIHPSASMHSVVDLLSDEEDRPVSIAATLRLPDSSALVDVFSCPPTPRLSSQDHQAPFQNGGEIDRLVSEHLDEVGDIDPHELSYVLPSANENAPPGNQTQPNERRVFKPWECDQIDWAKLSLAELKQWMQFFGMKTTGGKAFMISQLSNVFKYVGTDEAVPLPSSSSAPVATKEDLFGVFSQLIHTNVALYEKIILFESVDVGDVYKFLRAADPDLKFRFQVVKEYLDRIGAQYSNTASNAYFNGGQTGRRAREDEDSQRSGHNGPAKKSRKQLRRSITCP